MLVTNYSQPFSFQFLERELAVTLGFRVPNQILIHIIILVTYKCKSHIFKEVSMVYLWTWYETRHVALWYKARGLLDRSP